LGFVLKLTFSDGLTAEIDFSEWIRRHPFFEPLRNIDYFANFQLDGWTVVWPNGADVAPEAPHQVRLEKQPLQAT
jgi:hypothetical protein